MVQSARAGIEEIDPEIEDAARIDGASNLQIVQLITLPVSRRSILAGLVLGSARAMGEFGVRATVQGEASSRRVLEPNNLRRMQCAVVNAYQFVVVNITASSILLGFSGDQVSVK